MIGFLKKYLVHIFILFYFFVAFHNDGFMGTDEYWNAMVKYLPAQSSKITELVAFDDVKSPLQVMPMYLGAQLALKLNIQHPYSQYRFTIVFLALINILIFLFAFKLLKKYKNWDTEQEFTTFVGLMTFYFAAAFALTRPMFESLSAPWILLSCGLFLKYEKTNNISALIFSTLAISMAFVLRQQTGIGALTLPIILIFLLRMQKISIKDLGVCAIVGILAFIVAGIPDLILRGQFHYSLIAVTTYNMEHGHEYGNGSILFYPLMLVLMTFLPLFITKKYDSGFIKHQLLKQKFSLIFITLFVLLHSYFPQKFERFLISIIPLVLVVMTSFVSFLFKNYKDFKVRIAVLLILNFVILATASLQASQGNIIKMALYIDKNPELTTVYNFEKTLEWIPEKFINNNKNYQIIDANSEFIASLAPVSFSCQQVIVVNEFLFETHKDLFNSFQVKDKFNVNFIEAIAYKFNKKNNIRRSPLIILGCKNSV